nr:acetyl-CoA carboxylase, carboxyltransferase subunit beta [Flavobacterium sp.]
MEENFDKQKKPKWWQRLTKNINTDTSEKLETPDGMWFKCKKCNHTMVFDDYKDNVYICSSCDYHGRIGSQEYFNLLFDEQIYTKLFSNVKATDKLNFIDEKPYQDKLKQAYDKTGIDEAISVAKGKIEGLDIIIACMDFSFIGGSMGSVVGTRISKAIQQCIDDKCGFLLISKSGGARMMESAFSLMQMARTSAMLTLLAKAKLPYISLMTDPTTGGVSASYAMLGDLNISEPNALIGFAGPRVVKETIKKELPKGFQSAEATLENGFLDYIVHRKNLKAT